DLGLQWLSFDREQNPGVLRTIRRGSPDGFPIAAARVKSAGKGGATVAVKAVRLYDVSRDRIAQQIDQMKRWNVLPNIMSYHGGYSSWTNCQEPGGPVTLSSPIKGSSDSVVEQYPRPPFGCTASAATYCADLLRDAGVVFLSRTV